jgi:hypothetical protein
MENRRRRLRRKSKIQYALKLLMPIYCIAGPIFAIAGSRPHASLFKIRNPVLAVIHCHVARRIATFVRLYDYDISGFRLIPSHVSIRRKRIGGSIVPCCYRFKSRFFKPGSIIFCVFGGLYIKTSSIKRLPDKFGAFILRFWFRFLLKMRNSILNTLLSGIIVR